MILVVLSTHAELASATARGRSYWETGQLIIIYTFSENDDLTPVTPNDPNAPEAFVFFKDISY